MKTEVVVLCEDMAQATFIRRFLQLRGYKKPWQITIRPLSGKHGGSGEQYVRNHFPNEMRALRAKKNKALVAMIDADTGSVARRKQQLNEACDAEGVSRWTADDHAVIAVPKRNIETWFLYLSNEAWDEESDGAAEKAMKKEMRAAACAERLHDMCYKEQRLVAPAPSSLEDACVQWQRF